MIFILPPEGSRRWTQPTAHEGRRRLIGWSLLEAIGAPNTGAKRPPEVHLGIFRFCLCVPFIAYLHASIGRRRRWPVQTTTARKVPSVAFQSILCSLRSQSPF